MGNFCDYKISKIISRGNHYEVDAVIYEGDYDEEDYIRDGIISYHTLWVEFCPAIYEYIELLLKAIIIDEQGNKEIIPECQ